MPIVLLKRCILIVLLVLLTTLPTACSLESSSGTSVVTPSPAVIAPSPSPTYTPSPTVPVCRDQTGGVKDFEVPSKLLSAPLAVKVYTPPCYDEKSTYPVLFLLHGQTYSNDQWVRLGVVEKADQMIASHEINPMIIVMPYEVSSMTDPNTSKFDQVVANELVPWVDENYATCGSRACRAIGGLSRGGNWAVRIGFSNQKLFSIIGAHSTPLFFGDQTRLTTWVNGLPSPDDTPMVYMDMGKSDENRNEIVQFEQVLSQLGVEHEFYQFTGYHDETYWSEHVGEYLRWYSWALQNAEEVDQ